MSDLPNSLEEYSENVKQNFAVEVEDALNQQIALELNASYIYLALVNFLAI